MHTDDRGDLMPIRICICDAYIANYAYIPACRYMTIENTCYIWVAEEMTYEDAWNYCGDEQGELVAIESPDTRPYLPVSNFL